MNAIRVLFLMCVVSGFAYGADANRTVQMFTLTDGTRIPAMNSISSTVAGRTVYNVTEPSGTQVSFDASRVASVVVVPYAQVGNVEPYIGPNLGLGRDSGRDRSNCNRGYGSALGFGYPAYQNFSTQVLDGNGLHSLNNGLNNGVTDSPVIGLRHSNTSNSNGMKGWPNGMNNWPNRSQNGVVSGNVNNFQNFNSNAGPAIGVNPNAAPLSSAPSNWNASLSDIGGTYIPNNPNQKGFGSALNTWNSNLAAAGGTYISNNTAMSGWPSNTMQNNGNHACSPANTNSSSTSMSGWPSSTSTNSVSHMTSGWPSNSTANRSSGTPSSTSANSGRQMTSGRPASTVTHSPCVQSAVAQPAAAHVDTSSHNATPSAAMPAPRR